MSPDMQIRTARFRARLADERGAALIIALMSMMLLTALAAAVVMVTNTETMISANHRNSQEALYAADAAVERIVQDLLMTPRWNDVLAGSVQSSFIDGGDVDQDPADRRIDGALLRHQHRDDAAAVRHRHAEPLGRQQPAVEAVRLGTALRHPQQLADRQQHLRRRLGGRRSADSVDGATPDGNPMNDSNGVLTRMSLAGRHEERSSR